MTFLPNPINLKKKNRIGSEALDRIGSTKIGSDLDRIGRLSKILDRFGRLPKNRIGSVGSKNKSDQIGIGLVFLKSGFPYILTAKNSLFCFLCQINGWYWLEKHFKESQKNSFAKTPKPKYLVEAPITVARGS